MLEIRTVKIVAWNRLFSRCGKQSVKSPVFSVLALLALIAFLGACVHGGSSRSNPPRLGLFFKVKVRPGDKLENIAQSFTIPAARIRWVNGLTSSRSLQPGMILTIPVSTAALQSPRIRRNYPIYQAASSSEGTGIPELGSGVAWPVDGIVTWSYGQRDGKPHQGIDISTSEGTRIRSAHQGKVAFAGWKRGYGWTVIVDHRNFRTLYAHCRSINVKKDQYVARGTQLGLVGRSGNADGAHLHFEYRSAVGAPLDPLPRLALNYGH